MFSNPVEVADALIDIIEMNQNSLRIAYVGKYGEKLMPKYPAVLIDAGPLVRNHATTHQFEVQFTAIIWVYHSRMSQTHSQRSREDLQMVAEITKLLHTAPNYTLGVDSNGKPNIIFGYVDSEAPGYFNRPKGEIVVGSRLTWTGESRVIWR